MNILDIFEIDNSNITMGYECTIKVKYNRLDIRKQFLSMRAVNIWNRLRKNLLTVIFWKVLKLGWIKI